MLFRSRIAPGPVHASFKADKPEQGDLFARLAGSHGPQIDEPRKTSAPPIRDGHHIGLTAQNHADPMAQAIPDVNASYGQGTRKQLGGWLAVLVVWLGFGIPLFGLAYLMHFLSYTPSKYPSYVGLKSVYAYPLIASWLVASFISAYTAYRIKNKPSPDLQRLTVKVLWLAILGPLLIEALLYFMFYSYSIAGFLAHVAVYMGWPTAIAIAWVSYLRNSSSAKRHLGLV